MNVEAQTQEVVSTVADRQEQFVAVQDLDLMFVGGGSTAVLF